MIGFLFRALVGAVVPLSVSALALMKAELKKNGILADALPPAALRERVEMWISIAEIMPVKSRNKSTQVVDKIEHDAVLIAAFLKQEPGAFIGEHFEKWANDHKITPSARYLA